MKITAYIVLQKMSGCNILWYFLQKMRKKIPQTVWPAGGLWNQPNSTSLINITQKPTSRA